MNSTDRWIEINIAVSPIILEELSFAFFNMGCEGINENEENFTLYFSKDLWDDSKKNELNSILAKKEISASKISYSSLKAENWNENWKENFKTFRVGENIIVKPDWESYQAKTDEHVVTIIPKMAFGTGHHETTQLILKQLEGIIKPGMSVLDAGTGTAILAIYCALMGAEKITAFDTDPIAIDNAQENTSLNNVADKIDLQCASLGDIKSENYDLIIANINRNVLLELAASFTRYAKEGTFLVLSGLLHTDEETILKLYNKEGWQLQSSDALGEWIALNFKILK